jgi:hypothetical protein
MMAERVQKAKALYVIEIRDAEISALTELLRRVLREAEFDGHRQSCVHEGCLYRDITSALARFNAAPAEAQS